jgi:hypothetical protein
LMEAKHFLLQILHKCSLVTWILLLQGYSFHPRCVTSISSFVYTCNQHLKCNNYFHLSYILLLALLPFVIRCREDENKCCI